MNNPYPHLSDEQYEQLITAHHVKASASNGNGGCVRVAADGDNVSIQDDKLLESERLSRSQVFTRTEFAAFLEGAKAGEFDHLI